VLMLTARISIEEEERVNREARLEGVMPLLVKDVLTNPQLKAVRACYGSPDDKRIALLNSAAWTWPEKFPVPGFERTPARRAGQPLLGMRVDHVQGEETEMLLNVSLVNAGGTANGATVGAGTLRYTARQKAGVWVVELIEEP